MFNAGSKKTFNNLRSEEKELAWNVTLPPFQYSFSVGVVLMSIVGNEKPEGEIDVNRSNNKTIFMTYDFFMVAVVLM